ncbi:MAG: IS110 family transposase [Solirubrobacteraceae bacterium]
METLIARCCGLDVHKAQVTACVRLLINGAVTEIVETFGTTTPDLLALRDWLTSHGVTHVAMESTGVYWKPVYYTLEDEFEVLLVNAQHVKHVPGRKTDTIDAGWIAKLLAHGLLRGSFVPPKPIRRLRDLTRFRKALMMGVSGRAMMRALIEGQAEPEALAELAKGKLRKKLPELRKALTHRFSGHHAFLLERMLAHVEELEDDIGALSVRIEEEIGPFEPAVELLRSIPGVERRAAEVLVAELGTDMTVFPTAGHLASWAGVCPGQNESAGKRKSAKTRKGSKWLRKTLTESARAAARTRETYLSERYRRLAARRGDKKAVIAICHEILCAAWHMLQTGELYREQGADQFRQRDQDRIRKRAINQLEKLGHKVILEELSAAPGGRLTPAPPLPPALIF